MPDLLVTRALSNPVGDRIAGRTTNKQLNGEWVEFANTIQRSLSLGGVAISYYTFNRHCEKTGEDRLTILSGSLSPGWAARVRTGSGTPWDEGTVRHLYIGRSELRLEQRLRGHGRAQEQPGPVARLDRL